MSHIYSKIVSSVLTGIVAQYRNTAKMTITRCKIHKYLGMTINYYFTGKVISSMVDHIGNMLDEIPEDMKGGSATLSKHYLFDIVEDATKIP